MIKKRWNLGSVSSESAHRSCVPEVAKLVPRAASYPWSCVRVSKVVLVLKQEQGHGEKLRLGNVWQSWGPWRRGYWWKYSPVAARDLSILEVPVPWLNCQEQQQWWSGDSLGLGDNLCVLRGESQRRDLGPLEESCRLWVDPRHWTLSYLHGWGLVLLCSDCGQALVLSSWNKKAFNLFFFIL